VKQKCLERQTPHFFITPTPTHQPFGLAARRLGAETLSTQPHRLYTSKGETFIDTAKNTRVMGIDAVVVRHASSGAPHLLAQHLNCAPIIKMAGDGATRAPTQGFAPTIFTIRQKLGRSKDCRWPRRRHRAQPRRPQQHTTASPSSAPKSSPAARDAHADTMRDLGVEVSHNDNFTALRRHQHAPHSVRASSATVCSPPIPGICPACSQ